MKQLNSCFFVGYGSIQMYTDYIRKLLVFLKSFKDRKPKMCTKNLS